MDGVDSWHLADGEELSAELPAVNVGPVDRLLVHRVREIDNLPELGMWEPVVLGAGLLVSETQPSQAPPDVHAASRFLEHFPGGRLFQFLPWFTATTGPDVGAIGRLHTEDVITAQDDRARRCNERHRGLQSIEIEID